MNSTVAACALLCLITPPIAMAEASAALTSGQMALNGYWGSPMPPMDKLSAAALAARDWRKDPVALKLQPWALARVAKAQAAEEAGQFVPSLYTTCIVAVVPGTGVPGGFAYGIEVLVEAKTVTFLYEGVRGMRIVHMDREHPRQLTPSWLGDSVGHWDGDTLVVDTIGFNDKNELMRFGAPNAPITHRMHVIQRLRVLNGHLEDEASFDDPGALTSPFMETTRFIPARPFQELICQENNHEGGVPTAEGMQTPWAVPTAP